MNPSRGLFKTDLLAGFWLTGESGGGRLLIESVHESKAVNGTREKTRIDLKSIS